LGEQKRDLALFVTATFFIYAFTTVYYLFASFLESQGRGSAAVGLLISAYYVTVSLIRPFGGWMTEQMGVRKTLVAAGLIAAVGGLLPLGDPSTARLLLARVVTGVGFGSYCVALTSLQCLVVPDRLRGSTFAMTTIGSIAPLFLVIPVADGLLQRGLFTAYLIEAPLLALAAATMAFFLPDREGGACVTRPAWGSYGQLFARSGMKLLLLSAFAFAVTDSAIVYVANLAGAKGLSASPFIAISGVAALVVRLLGRNLMDRLPRRKLAGPSFGLMALALLWASAAGNMTGLALAGALFGAGLGVAFPVHLALVGDLAPAELRPKGTAMVYLAQDLSWMGLPLFIGFTSPLLGLPGAFRALAGFALAASVALTLFWKRPSRA
jgi:MFS family permease